MGYNTYLKTVSNMRFVLLLVFSLTLAGTAFSQQDRSKIIINGSTYYLYKVKKGEGLYRISKNFGVSQQEILDANPEAINGLKEGQLLKIPVISGRNSTDSEIRNSGKYIFHTVEKGQTVFYISHKYNVPEKVIYDNNPGSRKQLIEGTIIKIPVDEIEKSPSSDSGDGFVMHKVTSKETLYGLSKKYNVSQQDIINANPALKNGLLPVGSTLRIPVRKQKKKEVIVTDEGSEQKDSPLQDDRYEYYKIQPGETMYSIARKFNADVHSIETANSGVDKNDLPVGYLLRIPKESIDTQKKPQKHSDSDLFKKHKVKRKETLFSISRMYNVEVEILKKVNQGLNLNKLKKGSILKIPTKLWFEEVYYRELEKKKQEELKVKKIIEDSIAYADCISYDYYTLKPDLKIGLMLPFDVYDSKEINILKEEDDNGEIIETEREDKIISNKSKVFVEFYEGMLLALDKLKKEGTNIELFVYDTQSDSTDKIMDILKRPEVADLDMIIGPAFAINLKPVSDFAKQHDIKMVYPFSKRNPELPSNPVLFQVSPIDTLLFDEMQTEMLRNTEGKRIIVIRTKDESDYEKKLSNSIKEKIYLNSFSTGERPDYVEFKYSSGAINGLEELFDRENENIVIIPSNNEAHVSGIVTTVAGIVRSKRLTATLWGFPEWLRFQSLKPEDVHQLNGHIFSYYRLDYDDPETVDFIKKFREWYHTEPMPISSYFRKSSVTSHFSRYGIWGYDVSYYFINALKTYGKNFEYCLDEYHPKLIQSNFKFQRISNWGGMYNMGLFIMHFTPDYQMYVKELK